jgi:pimeloyl-ACP methyl ester carboxylesterase
MKALPAMMLRKLAAAAALATAFGASAATAPDDARESRWADEVVPQLVVGDAVWLSTPQRARVLALYTEPSGTAKGAAIVVHGLGVHPDWELIGARRSALPQRGVATRSGQLPVLAANTAPEPYVDLFPVAGERLDAALAWLRARGHTKVAVVSHSMGAAMVNAWLARGAPGRVDAWVPIGLAVAFAAPPRVPVLDVIGERDYRDVLAMAKERKAALPRDRCSQAVTISGTDHFLAGAVPRAVDRIAPFLEQAFAGNC